MDKNSVVEKLKNLKEGQSFRDDEENVWAYVEYSKITPEEAEEMINRADNNEYHFNCRLCNVRAIHIKESYGSRDTYDYLVCKSCCLLFMDKGCY